MKKENGITTSSVIIYVIAITIVIAVFSVITTNFYNKIHAINEKNMYSKKYTEFVSCFAQDIEQEDNKAIDAGTINSEQGEAIQYIKFKNGNIYKFSLNNNAIYRNNTKICENIDNCTFKIEKYNDIKNKITVEFKSGNFDKTGENALVFYI